MVYTIQQILEGRSKPVCVTRETPVIDALDLMIEYDYSQLPVINQSDVPVGIITYESIIKGIRNFKASLDDISVRNVMIKPALSNEEESLSDLLNQLKQTNAVLIVDNDLKLVGIVTSYDSTEYFRDRSEDLMRVQDIEITIKDLILSAYQGTDGSPDKTRLNHTIKDITKNKAPDNGDKDSIDFEQLTLGDYIHLLLHGITWKYVEPILKMKREAVRALLNSVQETRNDLVHIRGDISPFQSDQLRYCMDWLDQSLKEYYQQDAQNLELQGSKPHEIHPQTDVGKKSEIPDQAKGSEIRDDSIMPEEKRSKDSRYGPLADYLQGQPGEIDQLVLSFDDIGNIINGPLPASARTHRVWWTNDTQVHPHSQLWLEAGWRTTYVNIPEQRVTFARIRDRGIAYINFFNKLLADLRQKADFRIPNVFPRGASWVSCQTISTGRARAVFVYSFTRGKRFRVEFYIEASVWENTKIIFDKIYEHRSILEAELGEISWERINEKRASRIALYHPGSITDDEDKLSALRAWAVENMIRFYKKLEPIASKVIDEVFYIDMSFTVPE